MSLLNIGASGLAAAYAGLTTSGHNVANVNTPGYSRQDIVQANTPGQFTGSGYIGRGVDVQTVQRAFDAQVTSQVQFAQSQSSEAATQSTLMKQIDQLFAADGTGINGALDSFTASITQASSRPDDMASRAAVLSAGSQLASRINSAASRLDGFGRNADLAVTATAATINTLAAKIAALNDTIAISQGAGQPPNDLLDQRDEMIRSLNEQVGVTALPQSNGALNIFLSSGTALVVGNQAATLSVVADPSIPNRQNVNISMAGPGAAANIQLTATSLSGGALSAQLKFRSINLADAQNELGRLATAVASAYSQVHVLGTDMNGNPGTSLFAVGAPQAYAKVGNAGSGSVGVAVATASALQASDYRIDYNGAQYTITRLQDGQRTQANSFPVALDGLTLTLAGAPAAGDAFFVQPVRNAASTMSQVVTDPRALAFGLSTAQGDNLNALALADVANQPALGGLTLSQAFGATSATIGATASSLNMNAGVADKVLQQSLADQSTVSGVNLDEEAAKLIQYQQAYQASAKVIATAQTVFQSLLDLTH